MSQCTKYCPGSKNKKVKFEKASRMPELATGICPPIAVVVLMLTVWVDWSVVHMMESPARSTSRRDDTVMFQPTS